MRAIADAKQTFARPALQSIDLHRQQLDLRPIVQFGDAILDEWRHRDDVSVKFRETAALDLLKSVFWNDQADLEIVVPIEQNEKPAMPEKSERLFWIALAF